MIVWEKMMNASDRADVFNLAVAEVCVGRVLDKADPRSRRANALRAILEYIDKADATYASRMDKKHLATMERVLDQFYDSCESLRDIDRREAKMLLGCEGEESTIP